MTDNEFKVSSALADAEQAIRELVTAQANRICRNCRWWGGNTKIECPPEWSGCQLADSWHEKEHERSLARACDAELYHAVLHTAPNFGCVQWEGKEDVPVQDYARPST